MRVGEEGPELFVPRKGKMAWWQYVVVLLLAGSFAFWLWVLIQYPVAVAALLQ